MRVRVRLGATSCASFHTGFWISIEKRRNVCPFCFLVEFLGLLGFQQSEQNRSEAFLVQQEHVTMFTVKVTVATHTHTHTFKP